MARKTGFTKTMYNEYRRSKSLGMTDKAVAQNWGISPSTLSRAKTGKTKRVSARTVDKMVVGITTGTDSAITYKEARTRLLGTSESDRRKYAIAKKQFDMFPTDSEGQPKQRRLIMERTIKGVKVRWLYGRGKDDQVRDEVIKSLQAKGMSLSDAADLYNEATGYTKESGY